MMFVNSAIYKKFSKMHAKIPEAVCMINMMKPTKQIDHIMAVCNQTEHTWAATGNQTCKA